jgi:glutamate racemase
MTDAEKLAVFFAKDRVTVCVTDVGLGGLSVLSEIERRLQTDPLFPEVDLLYFNAAVNPGYTQRPVADQIDIFDAALVGMEAYEPDIILIACNTLSVLYGDTQWQATAAVPVVNIVDFGVALFADTMLADPGSIALIFGTDTTAQVAAHRTALAARGVDPARVVMQGCPKLATSIQAKGADSAEADALLSKFVSEAWASMTHRLRGTCTTPTTVLAGLCCTHYGYSLQLWEQALRRDASSSSAAAVTPVTRCINPNSDMATYIFSTSTRAPAPRTAISIRVLSMVPLVSEIEAIAPLGAFYLRTLLISQQLTVCNCCHILLYSKLGQVAFASTFLSVPARCSICTRGGCAAGVPAPENSC